MTEILDLVQTLQMALKAQAMYTAAHPRSQAAVRALAAAIGDWLETRPRLHLAATNGKVFADGEPVEAKSVHLAALARQFAERQISGLVLERGVPPEELAELLGILSLRPAQVEEAGGPAALFARKQLAHIQLGQVQYREVREGEGGPEESEGPGTMAPPKSREAKADEAMAAALAALVEDRRSGPGPGGAPAYDLKTIVAQWREQLAALSIHLPEEGPLYPASLGFLAGTPLAIGMGDGVPPTPLVEGLRLALRELAPEAQLAVVAGLGSLPGSHPGLILGFQTLAPGAFAAAAAALMTGGKAWDDTKGILFPILQGSPQRQALLAALEMELHARSAGPEAMARLAELVRQLEWENLSMEEKLRLAQERDQLQHLTLDQRLRFLRSLLDQGRFEAFVNLLVRIMDRLQEEVPAKREWAARTLNGVARWLVEPGLPPDAEGPMVQALAAHFGWEPVLTVHRITAESLAVVAASQVARREPGQALALYHELEGLCALQDDGQAWRGEALDNLRDRMVEPAVLAQVVEMLHGADPEALMGELIPYLELAGEPAGRQLVDTLGREPDRKRRGRLLEAIRSLGDLALPAVYEGLESPAWYLVRNTLNLLADIGDAGAVEPVRACLRHPDGRVKRAAVRTLWKVGGPAAVPHLLALLPHAEPATQEEIIFALGQVRVPAAIQALSEYALDKRNPERGRIRATETIGQIGDAAAVPVLAGLARRRGRFFTSAEPLEIRLAACRALAALDRPDARTALSQVVAAEPPNKDRSALQKVLDGVGSV